MRSPYPYFGSKKKVVKEVWKRFGEIENFIEPFFGSGAVLLANPKIPKMETLNDADAFIPNFWRAVIHDPDTVIKYADQPVMESDLHARHRWVLSEEAEEFRKKVNTDPNYFDAKVAGWWVYGMNSCIGITFGKKRGLHCKPFLNMTGQNITNPHEDTKAWIYALKERLKNVRVCCGGWERVCTPPVTFKNKSLTKNGIVGVFLDPPYLVEKRHDKLYRVETNVFDDVCKWAINNADNPKMRIAVCGFEGDYDFPKDWVQYNWQTNGGFSSFAKHEKQGKENSKREMIWFSKNCLIPDDLSIDEDENEECCVESETDSE